MKNAALAMYQMKSTLFSAAIALQQLCARWEYPLNGALLSIHSYLPARRSILGKTVPKVLSPEFTIMIRLIIY